jgi:hypothetical protein
MDPSQGGAASAHQPGRRHVCQFGDSVDDPTPPGFPFRITGCRQCVGSSAESQISISVVM